MTYVTTAGSASAWTIMTNEQPLIHQALAKRGIAYRTLEIVTGFDGEKLQLAQIFTGEPRRDRRPFSPSSSGSARAAARSSMNSMPWIIGKPHQIAVSDRRCPGPGRHSACRLSGQKDRKGTEPSASGIMVRRDAPFAPRDFIQQLAAQ